MNKREIFLEQYNKMNHQDHDIRHHLDKINLDIKKKNQKKSDLEEKLKKLQDKKYDKIFEMIMFDVQHLNLSCVYCKEKYHFNTDRFEMEEFFKEEEYKRILPCASCKQDHCSGHYEDVCEICDERTCLKCSLTGKCEKCGLHFCQDCGDGDSEMCHECNID